MTLNRVGVLSAGKIMGVLYAVMGLIGGIFLSLFAVMGTALGSLQNQSSPEAAFGLLFGIGAIIFLPIFYGVLGFVGGIILAAVYNLIARIIGGLELELE